MLNNFTETELSHEQWKDIEGYDGMYQVSDLGRVRSLKFGKTRLLRPGKYNGGYLMVVLCKDGKTKNHKVHRLVANAFLENDNLFNTEINHIDECKQNNRVSNLEYCDRSYNLTYNGLQQRRTANYHRSNYKRNAIKDLYNPNLSYKENIEIFMSNGIECCKQTLWYLRKDLGLIK